MRLDPLLLFTGICVLFTGRHMCARVCVQVCKRVRERVLMWIGYMCESICVSTCVGSARPLGGRGL